MNEKSSVGCIESVENSAVLLTQVSERTDSFEIEFEVQVF
jgi:hypothetical protein